jgi:hypothetical protein
LTTLRKSLTAVKKQIVASNGSVVEVSSLLRRVDEYGSVLRGCIEESQRQQSRVDLFTGTFEGSGGLRRRGNNSKNSKNKDGGAKDGGLTDGNSDASAIQKSLLRTKQMLSSELNRVSEIADTLKHDDESLKSVDSTYGVLNDLSKSAKSVLLGLELGVYKERIWLWGTFGVWWFVVFYVVWKRVWIPFIF